MSKCLEATLQVFAGTICLTCSPNFQNFVELVIPNLIKIKANTRSCSNIYDACKDYLQMRRDFDGIMLNHAI